MKAISIFSIILSLIFANCSHSNVKEIGGSAKQVDEKVIEQAVVLKPVDGYFTTLRPESATALALDKTSFEAHFKPAATMSSLPTIVNFDTDKAIAIVLPETRNNTEIVIDSAYLKSNVLHVTYTIKKDGEERPFSIIPAKVCTFDGNLGITSISFNNGETVINL